MSTDELDLLRPQYRRIHLLLLQCLILLVVDHGQFEVGCLLLKQRGVILPAAALLDLSLEELLLLVHLVQHHLFFL
jgi:hypothetical protein